MLMSRLIVFFELEPNAMQLVLHALFSALKSRRLFLCLFPEAELTKDVELSPMSVYD